MGRKLHQNISGELPRTRGIIWTSKTERRLPNAWDEKFLSVRSNSPERNCLLRRPSPEVIDGDSGPGNENKCFILNYSLCKRLSILEQWQEEWASLQGSAHGFIMSSVAGVAGDGE